MRSALRVNQVRAPYALHGDRALVELAAVVGELGPVRWSTRPVGIIHVWARPGDRGCDPQSRIRWCSAWAAARRLDGGAGMVQALGALLLDAAGHDLAPGGGNLGGLADLDMGPLRETLGATTIVSSRAMWTTPCSARTAPLRCSGRRRAPDPMTSKRSSAASASDHDRL